MRGAGGDEVVGAREGAPVEEARTGDGAWHDEDNTAAVHAAPQPRGGVNDNAVQGAAVPACAGEEAGPHTPAPHVGEAAVGEEGTDDHRQLAGAHVDSAAAEAAQRFDDGERFCGEGKSGDKPPLPKQSSEPSAAPRVTRQENYNMSRPPSRHNQNPSNPLYKNYDGRPTSGELTSLSFSCVLLFYFLIRFPFAIETNYLLTNTLSWLLQT